MNIKRCLVLAVGSLGAALSLAAPVLAQGHGGGGGHAGGGGSHAGGSVGHAAPAGHFSSGHFGGGATSHYSAYGAGHAYAGGAHYATGFHGSSYGGRPAYGYPGGGGYGHGYSTGAYWGGGYWHGGFWPRAYYGLGFSWFLPVLPLAYATYWWGGMPYYYANDVYYTWNPDYNGYTATDPPPVSDPSGSAQGGSAEAAPAPPPAQDQSTGGGPPGAGAGAQIFMYPMNGQSDAQQSVDKRECQQWAANQAGASNAADYRRAMMACVEGRGYKAN